jgi:hypothetical protein
LAYGEHELLFDHFSGLGVGEGVRALSRVSTKLLVVPTTLKIAEGFNRKVTVTCSPLSQSRVTIGAFGLFTGSADAVPTAAPPR